MIRASAGNGVSGSKGIEERLHATPRDGIVLPYTGKVNRPFTMASDRQRRPFPSKAQSATIPGTWFIDNNKRMRPDVCNA